MTPTGMKIPIIDLSGTEQDEAVRQIRHACETVGFFYVQNHGVPEEVLQRCLNASAQFFSLSDDAKMLLWQENPISVNVGYRPSLNSKVDPSGTHDLMEGLTFQWEELDDRVPRNKWPAGLPGLREAVLQYYAHMHELGSMLYRLISLAMGLGDDFFSDKTKSNLSRMRLLRYPPQTEEVVSIGAHSDFGTFTILLQQPGIEALQGAVLNTGWTSIPAVPGTLVVNLGDQTAICTNGVFRSPLHRVVSPSGIERYSVPVFFMADVDVVLQPHESFVTEERPSGYTSMTAGARFEARLAAFKN